MCADWSGPGKLPEPFSGEAALTVTLHRDGKPPRHSVIAIKDYLLGTSLTREQALTYAFNASRHNLLVFLRDEDAEERARFR